MNISLPIAFLGGIISFISPCVLPLIPMYIAYITGVSIQQLKEGEKKPLFKIFLNSLVFVLGFTLIFTILAAILYLFVNNLGSGFKTWFNRIAGTLIAVFGLHVMGVISIPFLNYEVKMDVKQHKGSLISSFLMGVAFGAGWTPCIGPILSGILFTSAASSNPFSAVLLLIIYSLGIGIPFILTGLATNRLLSIFNVIKKHYKTVEIISGLFLIVLGLMIAFDLIGLVSNWFASTFPALFDIESKIVH